jgi:hypothetical protein
MGTHPYCRFREILAPPIVPLAPAIDSFWVSEENKLGSRIDREPRSQNGDRSVCPGELLEEGELSPGGLHSLLYSFPCRTRVNQAKPVFRIFGENRLKHAGSGK